MQLGNNIKAALGVEGGSGSETLKKSLDGYKDSLLPHLAEDLDKKTRDAKAILMKEVSKGPLKYTIVGGNKKKRGRIQRGKK
jgi:membrane-bound lytic murein transglycosylase MltF